MQQTLTAFLTISKRSAFENICLKIVKLCIFTAPFELNIIIFLLEIVLEIALRDLNVNSVTFRKIQF